ncbi:hypothetical protein D3C86_1039730 [compost metagenome]
MPSEPRHTFTPVSRRARNGGTAQSAGAELISEMPNVARRSATGLTWLHGNIPRQYAWLIITRPWRPNRSV